MNENPASTGPATSRSRICAIIVTFHPDDGFPSRLAAISAQVDRVIVVDNNSSDASIALTRNELLGQNGHLISNRRNVGIAEALNQGLAFALNAGYRWAITLDQDSAPAPDMVAELCSTLDRTEAPDEVAVVSPNVTLESTEASQGYWPRPHPSVPWLFERARIGSHDLTGVTLTITSGSLMSLTIYERLGPFRNDFFIDYVDTEYCLRAQIAGYKILVSAKAVLRHRLGDMKEMAVAGYAVRPRFHSPDRIYYQYRNRIPTLFRYGRAVPHWTSFDVVTSTYNLLRIMLFEDRRLEKIRAAATGTWHGLTGRMGPR